MRDGYGNTDKRHKYAQQMILQLKYEIPPNLWNTL